jgi:transcription elongation GreA/GreB family factor
VSDPADPARSIAPDRNTLIAGLRAGLKQQIDALARMIEASRDEATGSESKAENKYDTRATEASYLAAGQGRRLADLRQLAAWADTLTVAPLSRVALGAVVQVRFEDESERWLMLAPQGGSEVAVTTRAGHPLPIALVGASSPMGRALLGCLPGDAIEVPTPSGDREVEVLSVH